MQLESSQVSGKLGLFFAIPLAFYDVILWFFVRGLPVVCCWVAGLRGTDQGDEARVGRYFYRYS